MLTPFKFKPIFKDKIWGGEKIRTVLKKDFSPLDNCGESWELSGVEGNVSVVKEGDLAGKDLRELIREFKGRLLGERVYRKFGDDFPLLIKFIDANEDLSIQVHPDDRLARERHGSFGKTEMWYIIQADQDAELITGFNREMDRDTYLDAFQKGNLMKVLNQEKVEKDDVFFIPAGRVHTIGKGLLLAEIQQTSDITYRIYDFDRVDSRGMKRELHVEEALDAIDYHHYPEYKTSYDDRLNARTPLVSCPYFTTSKIWLDNGMERNYDDLDAFVILIGIEGAGSFQAGSFNTELKKGEVVLIPAETEKILLQPKGEMKILETFVTPEHE